MRVLRSTVVVLVVLSLLVAAYAAGIGTWWLVTRARTQPSDEEAENLTTFWEAWHILDDEFLGEPPSEVERARGAIHGMVGAFNDAYTIYLEPEPRELERDEMRGRFGGIGAWVTQDEAGNIVLSPMPDRPAALAGILDGDILVSVDRQLVTGLSSQQVVALIRGPLGSSVHLVVQRPETDESLEFDVKRDEIELPTVQYRTLQEDPPVGYVSIRLIGERTPQELTDALKSLGDAGVQRVALDLRGNPGGALTASVDVTSQFVSGSVVLYEQRKDGQEKPYYAQRGGLALDWPIVVLVDAGTASGSEIIAGALQDHERAVLVGERTFGKGSVQHVHDLSDGSSLHVTVARWLTPKRQQLDGAGLTPDEIVVRTEEDIAAGRDPQLERAIELLVGQGG
jgi:carboxyl-terminal processing protease